MTYPIATFVQSPNALHLYSILNPVGNNPFASATHSGSFFGRLILVCFPAVTKDQSFSPRSHRGVENGTDPLALIKFLGFLCLLLFL